MKNKFYLSAVLSVIYLSALAQHTVISLAEARNSGLMQKLDSIYNSAINVADTSLAVFKTESEQEANHKAWINLCQDIKDFCKKNNFIWEMKIKCFQRVYFNSDGTIDYFIYNFKIKDVNPEGTPSIEKQNEFSRLLNMFIQEYKYNMTATKKFTQCGGVFYNASE